MIVAQTDMITIAFWATVLAAGVRLAVSVGMAALGEMINERAGVLNLGVQGMILTGAVAGFWAGSVTGSLVWGVVAAMCGGAALAAVHAFTAVTLRVNQIVSGLALALFGGG